MTKDLRRWFLKDIYTVFSLGDQLGNSKCLTISNTTKLLRENEVGHGTRFRSHSLKVICGRSENNNRKLNDINCFVV